MSKKGPAIVYELRYTGEYGQSLYSRHGDYEEALVAKRLAIRTALAWGNARLANSLEIV